MMYNVLWKEAKKGLVSLEGNVYFSFHHDNIYYSETMKPVSKPRFINIAIESREL